IGSGGLAVSVAKACMGAEIGAVIRIGHGQQRAQMVALEMLFTESASAVVVSCAPEKIAEVKAIAERRRLFALEIGRVGGGALAISVDGVPVISARVEEMKAVWSGSLESHLTEEVTA
ncbi:MAG TPA: AIR synthase-related protein, partial [Acidobacteriaceae bacterium]|nr:AIR synthase-related protein [Acidobacteriaceae bacterium]